MSNVFLTNMLKSTQSFAKISLNFAHQLSELSRSQTLKVSQLLKSTYLSPTLLQPV